MIEIQKSPDAADEQRDVVQAAWRGWTQLCPACGEGAIYRKFLKVSDTCTRCGEELHHHRADDAPPYFTILVVGHIIVGGLLALETAYAPETWVHYAIWLPLLLIMTFWFLPRIKGALVGLQWGLRMHGFGGSDPQDEEFAVHKPNFGNPDPS
jgi:uncharacterized protein (DUF983 family)